MFIKLLYHIIFYIMKYYSVQMITMCYNEFLLNTSKGIVRLHRLEILKVKSYKCLANSHLVFALNVFQI